VRRLSKWAVVAIALIALGCEEEEPSEAEAQAPEAVAPLEVTPDEEVAEGGEPDELSQLQARVAQLEGQLAQCGCEVPPEPSEGGAASGTQTAAVPEGVDVPEGAEAAADTESAGAEGADEEAGDAEASAARGRDRDRDPTLLGTLLGDEEEAERHRRRARRQAGSDQDDPETLELPNPASILLGD